MSSESESASAASSSGRSSSPVSSRQSRSRSSSSAKGSVSSKSRSNSSSSHHSESDVKLSKVAPHKSSVVALPIEAEVPWDFYGDDSSGDSVGKMFKRTADSCPEDIAIKYFSFSCQ